MSLSQGQNAVGELQHPGGLTLSSHFARALIPPRLWQQHEPKQAQK